MKNTTVKPASAPGSAVMSGCQMNAQDKATMVVQTFSNMRGTSVSAKVILWCGEGGTYGASGLNDPRDSCPELLYKRLSNEVLAKQYKVRVLP